MSDGEEYSASCAVQLECEVTSAEVQSDIAGHHWCAGRNPKCERVASRVASGELRVCGEQSGERRTLRQWRAEWRAENSMNVIVQSLKDACAAGYVFQKTISMLVWVNKQQS